MLRHKFSVLILGSRAIIRKRTVKGRRALCWLPATSRLCPADGGSETLLFSVPSAHAASWALLGPSPPASPRRSLSPFWPCSFPLCSRGFPAVRGPVWQHRTGQRRWKNRQGLGRSRNCRVRGEPSGESRTVIGHPGPLGQGRPMGRALTCCARLPSGRCGCGRCPQWCPCARGFCGDNLLFLVFCVHGLSGQDTAHHVPGGSGRALGRARWQRRL